LKSIKIIRNGKNIQQINITDDVEWVSGISVKKFDLNDWNFDSYKDITICTDISAKGNASYLIWIYSPKLKKFILNNQLSELFNLKLDSITKTIKSNFKEGQNESWKTLKYRNHKFITIDALIIEKYLSNSRGICVKTTRTKRINNRIKTTVDSVFEKQ
jgi:hypothetical protein